ncbi:MAG TPA: sigma-70 family RNA polymerase sigma factor [Nitriliruptorales bacterium]|nr:sigma-70 family RNA polymerase sigma factor [Nitriliruptorales bacterium]
MDDVAELVRAATAGDQRAWDGLVERFTGLVWSVARAHRLTTADAADVVQTTWLRLVEHLDTIRDPRRVGAWLATTARREALRTLRTTGRELPTDDEGDLRPTSMDTDAADQPLLAAERDALLWDVVESLTDQCRRLLRVLAADPPPTYQQVAAALGMPVGSIGPTRARCLDRLRAAVARAGITLDLRDRP